MKKLLALTICLTSLSSFAQVNTFAEVSAKNALSRPQLIRVVTQNLQGIGLLKALEDLNDTSPAFHSRTCGLVLLSNGRAQVRAVKKGGSAAFDQPMGELTKAFLLLRDGRKMQESKSAAREYFTERLSTGRTTQPAIQALPAATEHCTQWFEQRRIDADFDLSEEAKWDSVNQAELTFRSE